MKIVMDETRSIEPLTTFTMARVHEYFFIVRLSREKRVTIHFVENVFNFMYYERSAKRGAKFFRK